MNEFHLLVFKNQLAPKPTKIQFWAKDCSFTLRSVASTLSHPWAQRLLLLASLAGCFTAPKLDTSKLNNLDNRLGIFAIPLQIRRWDEHTVPLLTWPSTSQGWLADRSYYLPPSCKNQAVVGGRVVAKPWQTSSSEPAAKACLWISLSLPQFSRNLISISHWYLLDGVSWNRKPHPGKWKSTNKALLSSFTADAWLPAKPCYRVM